MNRLALATTAVLALGACMGEVQTPPTNGADADADACGASSLQALLGKPESVLKDMIFAGPLRVIHPGQAVTMDYSAARLNGEIDAAGLIARVNCG
ncbi:MAG: I78 family peptidase inhibitor [Pseudorhodobacter sp.]|nr:I78 family peptidase inhibitor [Pseudorhodobacter sp.]